VDSKNGEKLKSTLKLIFTKDADGSKNLKKPEKKKHKKMPQTQRKEIPNTKI
jgi:hypothetical protein